MTAKQIELTLTQNNETGEISVKANQPVSFNIMLRMYLVALKGLKDNLLNKVESSDRDSLIKMAFGEAYQEKVKEEAPEEAELKEKILEQMEGEMYDMLNMSISNFLDTEFPRINSKLSLTEEAAKEAGLDRTAKPEELVEAEKKFINEHPDIAAKTQELQPTEVKDFDKEGGQLNREQRRTLKFKKK